MHSPIHEFSDKEKLDMTNDRLCTDTDKDRKKAQHFPVQVVLRCRPSTSAEKKSSLPLALSCTTDQEIEVKTTDKGQKLTKTYKFDRVFSPGSTQNDVYDFAVRPIVQDVLLGFNCTVFAYGQTGTGKTHTMEGKLTTDLTARDAGVIPRSINTIFEHLEKHSKEFSVKVSVMEIYNEELSDLLCDDNSKNLRIFEDPAGKKGMMVSGLEEILVANADEVFALLRKSSEKRKTAETLLNKASSRSHSVFMVTTHTKEVQPDGDDVIRTGKLFLVDLAGSECVGKSGAMKERGFEAGKINQSLLTLGRVINALVEKSGYIPYRDSKLTRLLQESLGGRSKTVIIATVSPSVLCVDETLSTLDYAHRAKNIRNRPQVNQKLSGKAYMRELISEINELKRENEVLRQKNGIFLSPEKWECMTTELKEKTERLAAMDDELDEKQSQLDDANAVIAHHVVVEEEVVRQGQEVKERLEEALMQNNKLHDKLERKCKLDALNEASAATLHAALNTQFQTLQTSVNGHSSNTGTTLTQLSESLHSLVTVKTKELHELSAIVNAMLHNANESREKMVELVHGLSEEHDQLTSQHTEARALHCVTQAAALVEVQSKMAADVNALRTQLHNSQSEVEKWQGRVQSEVGECVSASKQFSTSISSALTDLHDAFLAHAKAQAVEVEEHNRALDALVRNQEEKGKAMGESVMETMQKLLSELQQAQVTGLQKSSQELKQALLSQQQNRGEFAEEVGSRVQQGIDSASTFANSRAKWGKELSALTTDSAHLVSTQHNQHIKDLSDLHDNAHQQIANVHSVESAHPETLAAQRDAERVVMMRAVSQSESLMSSLLSSSKSSTNTHTQLIAQVASSLGEKVESCVESVKNVKQSTTSFSADQTSKIKTSTHTLANFTLQSDQACGGTPPRPTRTSTSSINFKRSRKAEEVIEESRRTRKPKVRKPATTRTITLPRTPLSTPAITHTAAATAATTLPIPIPVPMFNGTQQSDAVVDVVEKQNDSIVSVGENDINKQQLIDLDSFSSSSSSVVNNDSVSECDADTTTTATNAHQTTSMNAPPTGGKNNTMITTDKKKAGGSKIPLFTGKPNNGGPVENLAEKFSTPAKTQQTPREKRRRKTAVEDKENAA